MTRSSKRPLCLVAAALLLTLAPVPGQVDPKADRPDAPGRAQPPRQVPNMARGAQPIQKPEDPSKIRGTYVLADRDLSLTEGQFYDTYVMLKPHEDKPQRPLQQQQVLEHYLLFKEAENMGFALSDEEKDLINPLKTRKAFAGAIKQRLEAWGISEAQYVQYLAEKRAIQRLKDWYATSVRVRSSEVYDIWKRDNFLYRLTFVEFSAEDLEAELRKTQPTEAQLREFYTTNPQIQNEMRIPTSVTADVVVFDPSSVSEEEIKRLQGERTISREEALRYFTTNKDRLVKQIRSEDRPKLYPPPGEEPPPVEKLVTPFMLLRSQIDRELVLGDRIQKAYDASATAKTSAEVKAAAEKHSLSSVRLEKASRQQTLTEHARLGPSLFTDLFNAQPGSRSAGVQFNGPLQFFWRLEAKAVSSLPPFEDVREKLVEPWFKYTAFQRAQDTAKGFLNEVQEAVKTVTGDREAEIDVEAGKKAEAEIERLGLTDDRRKDVERQKWRAWAENEKRTLRSTRMPEHFGAVVAKQGRKLKNHGPFSFSFGRTDRSKIEDKDASRRAYLESSFQIKALGPGHVSPILSDILTRTHFIVKVDSKEEPPFDRMSAVDYYQRRMAAERQNMFTTNYMWTGFQAQRRLKWKPTGK